MLWLLVFYSCIALSTACFCTPAQGTKESFCKSDWVSHVIVRGMKRSGGQDGDNAYTVQHIDVFKKPQNVPQLSTTVNTPSSDEACGITLQLGKEYLLAGAAWSKNDYFTFRCGQIVDDNPTKQTEFGMPIEWKYVSTETKSALKTINCDNYRDITKTKL